MRIYKNDIIKASAISTGADRGVLLCSITDSGFMSIAGVISAVKDKLPGKDHKKMIFEIRNDGRNEYGRYNNCGGPVLQSLESPALSNSEMPFRGRKTGQI